MAFSSREDGGDMMGGGASEWSEEVEELSSRGMGVIWGESKSISPSERARFLGGLAGHGDVALVTDDVASDKISTSSSLSESRSSSSDVVPKGVDVRVLNSHPRGRPYDGKVVLRR